MDSDLTPKHAHVIVDILQPAQRLKAKIAKNDKLKIEYHERQNRKGLDEFQIGLNDQMEWWESQTSSEQKRLKQLIANLSPDIMAFWLTFGISL